MASVVVVGSTNLDLVVIAPAIPAPGETVLGQEYVESAGGKGLNQAISAARHAATSLVAAVGDDAAAEVLREAARARKVSPAFVQVAGVPSGRALITVDAHAENAITVAPGANGELGPDQAVAELDRLRPDVVLAQCEVRPSVVAAAAAWCVEHEVRFVLNASPVRPDEAATLEHADPLVVNEHEAAAIAAALGHDGSDAGEFLAQRTRSVVITLGAAGALVRERDGRSERLSVEAAARVVDTTGAGDEYAGALAAALATGSSLVDAARRAGEAAGALIAKPREER